MLGLIFTLAAFYFYLEPDKRYLSIFLLLALVTAGFQLIPVPFFVLKPLGVTKSYDWLLVFCAIVMFFQPFVFLRIRIWKQYGNIAFFIFILLVLLLYSIYFAGVETSVAIRVFRNYLYVISFFLFIHCSKDDFIKVFRLVIYFTSIAAFFYCLQPFVGKGLLNGIGSEEFIFRGTGEVTRYYNLPVFIVPVIFFFFFRYEVFKIKYWQLLAVINLAAIVLSQHRSFLTAVVIMFFLNLLMENKVKLYKLVVYAAICSVFFLMVDNLLKGRFTSGLNDMSKASIKISDVKYLEVTDLPALTTSEFRKMHFLERLFFVLQDTKKAILGIGLATEDSRITNPLSFTVGTTIGENERVPQIATGDIAWSLLILNFGIIGIIAFLNFYFGFLKRFFILRRDELSKIGIYFILFLFIISFYGTAILQPYTLTMLVLFGAYAHVLQASKWPAAYQPSL